MPTIKEQILDSFLRKIRSALQSSRSSPIAPQSIPDIGTIRGQSEAKGAILVASAGGHNVRLIGPPGEGKSFLASTIPGILPELTSDERAERIRYLGSNYSDWRRPFISIGPTITQTSLIGGGRANPIPGAIALANRGILFIDELPQFSKPLIDSLRQPIESGYVNVMRSGNETRYPTKFIFVAAQNPCNCGYHGYGKCTCSQSDIARYQSKISGPILDRIDITISLDTINNDTRFGQGIDNQSLDFLRKVRSARERQRTRYQCNYTLNSDCSASSVFSPENTLQFAKDALALFQERTNNPKYSTRRIVRIARVARTVADVCSSDAIHPIHVSLALDLVA